MIHDSMPFSSKALLFILLLTSSMLANSHEIRPAIVNLNFLSNINAERNNELQMDVLLNLESMIAEIGPEHDDTEQSENSERYEKLRSMQPDALAKAFELFQDQLIAGITVLDRGANQYPVSVRSIDISPVGDIDIARDTKLILVATLPRQILAASWQWHEKFGEAIVRTNNDDPALDYAALLSPGQQSELIEFTQATQQSSFSVVKNYIVVGFEHILPKGLDHILFVIGLFLLTTRWQALLIQVTVFTIAHSITLALGATGWLQISASIVEPLIALSIVFICVENLVTANLSRFRIAIVFLFGLLHGLGFASVLGEVGLDTSNFIIALLGFNIGVELGQLFIVGLCLLLVGYWFGKKPWYRKSVSIPASLVIGAIGGYWFLQRIGFVA